MRILAVSHLFPHASEPRYGIFVARQLEAMAKAGAEIELIVPVACPPHQLLQLTGIRKPRRKLLEVAGVSSRVVPYPGLPGAWYKAHVGGVAGRRVVPLALQRHHDKPFDVVYGTNLFLGGDIAVRLGKRLGIPSSCLAIGSDVNHEPAISPRLLAAFNRIVGGLSGLLACGQSLADKLTDMRGDRCLCVYGVVDLDRYRPHHDRQKLRLKLGYPPEKPSSSTPVTCFARKAWWNCFRLLKTSMPNARTPNWFFVEPATMRRYCNRKLTGLPHGNRYTSLVQCIQRRFTAISRLRTCSFSQVTERECRTPSWKQWHVAFLW